MKKLITFIALLAICVIRAKAQSASGSASQTTNLNLADAIELAFVANNSATGAAVNFNFTTVNDYANGLESAGVQMRVRSNKTFNVSVKSSNSTFTYTGSSTPTPVMPVSSVLSYKITQNATGGWSWFSNYYWNLNSNNQTIIWDGDNGGDQTFTVMYRVRPGFAYPAGTYTTDVIYTATQQ